MLISFSQTLSIRHFCIDLSAKEGHRMHHSDYCLNFFLPLLSIPIKSVCNFAVKKSYPKKIMCAGNQCVDTVGGHGFAFRENFPFHSDCKEGFHFIAKLVLCLRYKQKC